MFITAHFNDIQSIILEELKKSKYTIYVAVAWITDKRIWKVLINKAKEGINVEIVFVPDEINQNLEDEFVNLAKSEGKIYWDEHHHKFCVIDQKTIISGSYNWTISAAHKINRENIIVIKNNEDLAEQFSDEFKNLIKSSKKFILPKEKEIVYIEKEIEKEVIKFVEKKEIEFKDKIVEVIQLKNVEKFRLYNKGIKTFCGDCHANKIVQDPKCPAKLKNIAKFQCKKCNTYYDYEGLSI